VELKLATVDEVLGTLRELGNRPDASPRNAASSAISSSELQAMPLQAGAQQDAATSLNLAAVSMLQEWLGSDPGRIRSAGNYYMSRLEGGRLFIDLDLAIARYGRERFPRESRFFELGFGFGELSLLLAFSGFCATGFESDSGRYAGATALAAALAQRGMDVGGLSLVHGSFPDALLLATLDKVGETVFVSTNVTSTQMMAKIDHVYRSLRLFDHLIIDLARFGEVRDEASQRALIEKLRDFGFVEAARVYSRGANDVRHFERRPAGPGDADAVSPPAVVEELRHSDLGSPVPRRLLKTPFHVFKASEVPIEAVLPRLPLVPRRWLPAAPIRIEAVKSVFGGSAADTAPTLREGPEPGTGSFAFGRFGGHRVSCGYGVFKCLTLDPKTNRDQQALEIFRFAAENIVHSCVDKAVILPWARRPRYIRPDLLLGKLFQSDQPLGIHCDHAAEVTAYLLHLGGYQVRGVSIIDPAVSSGHVVVEVFLPEQASWIMLDPDYGVAVSDRAGKLMGTAEIVECADRKRDLVVQRIVEKKWPPPAHNNVAEAHSGQLTLSPEVPMGRATVDGNSYHEVMDRCFRARRVFSYRNFEDGFEDNRLDAPEEAAPEATPRRGPAVEKTPDRQAASADAGSVEPADAVKGDKEMRDVVGFDPFKMFKSYFKLAGTVRLDACPVCESGHITQIWQLPQSRLDGKTFLSAPGSAHNNTYLDYLPLLKVPQEIFGFDICADCHSIFRNPKDDDQEIYKRDTSKVRSYKEHGLDPFRGTADTYISKFPANTHVVVDAACGSGQILAILRERNPELRLFGLELSAPSIEWMKSLGIDGAVTDLDLDDLDTHVAPGTVDFIVFNEAFEHVRSPLQVLKKMFRMLRPGGRIHFTAQYFGPENGLQIRVGEPIYIDRHGLDWVIAQVDAKLIDLKADIKYRVTLEKKA
jgi:SAM-dependent methyltransferase